MSGEIIGQKVECGRSDDDIRFKIHIEECLRFQLNRKVNLHHSMIRTFIKISSETACPEGTVK